MPPFSHEAGRPSERAPGGAAPAGTGPWELSATLWDERGASERLLDGLERRRSGSAQGAGAGRMVDAEIEAAARDLGLIRLRHGIELGIVAEAWDAPAGASLDQLAEHAPTEAWRFVFEGHSRAIVEVRARLDRASHAGPNAFSETS